MRQCLIASTSVVHLKHGGEDEEHDLARPLEVDEALFLATLGGQQVMKMDHELGNFYLGRSLTCW